MQRRSFLKGTGAALAAAGTALVYLVWSNLRWILTQNPIRTRKM